MLDVRTSFVSGKKKGTGFVSSQRMWKYGWLGLSTLLAFGVIVCGNELVETGSEVVSSGGNLGPYIAQWKEMKSMKKNLEERIVELENKVAHLEKPETLLHRLDELFKNPPSYLQSFIINLSLHKYKKRKVARNLDKWK